MPGSLSILRHLKKRYVLRQNYNSIYYKKMVNNLLGISNTFWGDYNEYSDADIMILTTLTDEEIAETILFDLAFDFQMDYGIDISVVVKNKD